MKRSKKDLVQAWLDKARKDIVMARMAVEHGEEFADMASFHAQQAAEKALKAYLIWLGIEFPKTHVLGQLLDLIGSQDDSLENLRDRLEVITAFAVETRYPESFMPSLTDVWDAIAAAEETYTQVCRRVGIL